MVLGEDEKRRREVVVKCWGERAGKIYIFQQVGYRYAAGGVEKGLGVNVRHGD